MTKAQTTLYWREWSAVRRYLLAFCDYSSKEVDAARKDIQARGLGGLDKSSKLLTNAEFDKVLGEFRAIYRQADLLGQIRQIEQPGTRLIYAVRQLGLPPAYLRQICMDQHRTGDWEGLPERELINFRFTATRAARRLKKRARSAVTAA